MSTDLVVQSSTVGGALSAKEVKNQVQLIQQVMSEVMIDGEHFGKIPGTDKNTLFKSGAEKLLLTFRLAPKYEEISVQESHQLISYRIRCILMHQASGTVIGEGLGACNTQEKKYRTVSVAENKATDEEKAIGKAEKRNGQGGGHYTVYVIPSNPYDLQNTVYKMACKRALVAAILNGTAASDIFKQDLEDMDVIPNDANKPEPTPEIKKPEAKTEAQAGTVTAGISIKYEDNDGKEAVKKIGFKWHAVKKVWYKVIDMNEYRDLAEKYPQIEVIE